MVWSWIFVMLADGDDFDDDTVPDPDMMLPVVAAPVPIPHEVTLVNCPRPINPRPLDDDISSACYGTAYSEGADSDIEFSDSSIASDLQPGSRFMKFTRDYQAYGLERCHHPFKTGTHYNMPPFTLPLQLDLSDPLQQRLLPPVYLAWNFVHLYRYYEAFGSNQYTLKGDYFWTLDDPDGFKAHGYIKNDFFLLHDQADYFLCLARFRAAHQATAPDHPAELILPPVDHYAVIDATRPRTDVRMMCEPPNGRRVNRTMRAALTREEALWYEHTLSFQLAATDCKNNTFNATTGYYAWKAQSLLQQDPQRRSYTYTNCRLSHPIDKLAVRLSKEAASNNQFNRFGDYIMKARALTAPLPGQYHKFKVASLSLLSSQTVTNITLR